MRRLALTGLVIVCLLVGSMAPADYHKTPDLLCSDCHIMHNAGGTAYDYLLIEESTNALCFTCHKDATGKPDVCGDDINGGTERAAGFFLAAGEGANPHGHDLGATTLPPADDQAAGEGNFTLSCAGCHDPHGTDSWRNLTMNPGEQAVGFVESGYEDFGDLGKYEAEHVGYKDGFSASCVTCHDGLDGEAHWKRHPSSNNYNAGVGYVYVSDAGEGAHWDAGTGSGFEEGVARVPFQDNTATDFVTAVNVGATENEPICFSCHQPHGGAYTYSLVWDYTDAGTIAEQVAACQQCHNK